MTTNPSDGPPALPPRRVVGAAPEDEYDDPPKIEERHCGTCLMFLPDKPLGVEGWGRCSFRGHSVTTKMQVVLKRNEPTCFMEAPS